MSEAWPAIPLNEWQDTCQTLHMWLQMAGKIRMAFAPPLNHWWHVTMAVTARGLTTGPIPYGEDSFEVEFDFIDHQLRISTCSGASTALALEAQPVAAFYTRLMDAVHGLGIDVTINTKPQEVPDPIPFDQDYTHKSYDPEYAHRFFRVLVSTNKVLQRFRSGYLGKASPVQFFWGSMDIACARFSGRPAVPPRPGRILGISHEEVSVGFWPGAGLGYPAFYAYAVPSPAGLETLPHWNAQLGEFVLPYEDVRQSSDPSETLYAFYTGVYEAAAERSHWDRAALEENYEIQKMQAH
jgi:hypothetical protein